MKIALVDPSLFTLPYDVRLATGLGRNGHEVIIFGQNPGGQQETDERGYLRQHFYPGFGSGFMRRLPPKIFLALKGLSHIESMFRLFFRLREWQPDVIHFQWTPLALIDGYFIPWFRRLAPTILTVHDSTPFNNNPRARIQGLNAIKIMGRFDQLIVHTGAARTRLIAHGFNDWKINVIPHGLLMDVNADPALNVEGTDDGCVRLLLFGHIKPYKGVDVLLRAIGQLPDGIRNNCRLRIVGRAKMLMEPLMRLASQLGIRNQVDFDLRFIPEDEIGDLMAQSDVLMFPYHEIDASGVLMIAIAAGKTIVASNIGLFKELLEDGVHGALVEPNNPTALAGALARLIEDRQHLRDAERAVKSLAEKIPGWEVIGRMTAAVYQRETTR